MNTSDVNALGSDIVAIQRAARFADTSTDEWAARIVRLIEAQVGHEGAQVSNVRQVGTAAGGSNGTLLFDASWSRDGIRLERALVLRFLPVEGLFLHYSASEQFMLQRALEGSDVPVAPQIWLDADGTFLVRPGYVMAQVAGQSTPMTWMTSGLIAEASPADRRTMIENYIAALVALHNVDWRARDVAWLETRGRGTRPIEREVNWYWDSLTWAAIRGYVKQLAPVREWLIANEPAGAEIVICHGDANLGNYMYDGTDISAVVDWEMSFLGTPECDVSYLLIGDEILQNDVAPLAGVPGYAERKAIYERLSGRVLRHLPYYELFTAYRMAVINVLAMKHFPADVLANFMPILERGPMLTLERARRLGVFLND